MPGYNLIRPLLFRLDPEYAHQQTIALLQKASNKPSRVTRLTERYRNKIPKLPIELFGKKLSNPVGLGAEDLTKTELHTLPYLHWDLDSLRSVQLHLERNQEILRYESSV